MGDSANRYDHYQERVTDRARKAESYTVNKSAAEKVRAKAHVHAANTVDFSVTALGSKTMGALTSGLWGLAKGTLIGLAAGAVVQSLLYGGIVVFGAVALYYTVKGCRDGYYHAEANYSGNKGKRVGDKIAAEGNAQAPKLKQKVAAKAAEKARDEAPEVSAAERQALEHHTPHSAAIGPHTQRVVDGRQAATPSPNLSK